MKKRHSFRRRLFAGFLLASLLPLLLCSAMLLQIFRLRLDSQLEEESREQLDHVISSLDGLYRGFQQTALALQASPYVAPALSRGQRDSTTVYSELYSATEGSRLSAQFDLYDRDGVWMYSTGSGPVEPVMPTQWGVLYAARQSVGLAFTQVDGGEGNSAPLFRGAARIAGEAGEDAGYLVITLTRADFQRLLEGTYGGQSDLLLLDRYWRPVYASQTALAGRLAVQLREQLLAGEELGLVGCLLILALLGAILFRCVWLAHRSRDPLFAAVAMGVAGVFGAQTILNIGMCLCVAPVVGVTLPFFSYGGSSLLTAFGGVGIVMSMKQEKLGGSGNWPGA